MYNNTILNNTILNNTTDESDKLNRFYMVYLTAIIFSFVIGKIMVYCNFQL